MDFGVVSIILIVLAAVFVLAASKLLFKRHWFLAFLRGFVGFSLLGLALLSVMLSLNIATYKPLSEGQVLAHISFSETAPQRYQALIMETGKGQETSYELRGDMWQIGAHSLKIAMLSKPYYQLNSLQARYYALEQETNLGEKPFALQNSTAGLDIWRIFAGKKAAIVNASKQTTSFLPIADGAVYTVTVAKKGLLIKPSNDAAKSVMDEWL